MAPRSVCRSEFFRKSTVVLALLLAGCGAGDRASARIAQMKEHWRGLLEGLRGGATPTPAPGATATASAAATPDPALESAKAKQAKANAEILREMLVVVLMQEPKDRSLFGNYVDSLNQGASLEGVYNGFSHSAYYRELETKVKGAAPAALDFFVNEMLALRKEAKFSPPLGDDAGKPLPTPVNLAEFPTGVEAVTRFGKNGAPAATPTPAPKGPSADQIRAAFKNSSIFTLKRALGDEALRVLDEKKQSIEELAAWYSRQVPRWIETGVDFGLPQRSNRDEGFHRKWAISSGSDRVTWEVLNRLHRILNAKAK